MSCKISKVKVSGTVASTVSLRKFSKLPAVLYENTVGTASSNAIAPMAIAPSSDGNSIFIAYNATSGPTYAADHVGIIKLNKSTLEIEARTVLQHSTITDSTFGYRMVAHGNYLYIGLNADQDLNSSGTSTTETVCGLVQLYQSNLGFYKKKMFLGISTYPTLMLGVGIAPGSTSLSFYTSANSLNAGVQQVPLSDITGTMSTFWDLRSVAYAHWSSSFCPSDATGTLILTTVGTTNKKPIIFPMNRSLAYNNARNVPKMFAFPAAGTNGAHYYTLRRMGTEYFASGVIWNNATSAWIGLVTKFSFTNNLTTNSNITHHVSYSVPVMTAVSSVVRGTDFFVGTIDNRIVRYNSSLTPVDAITISNTVNGPLRLGADGTKIYVTFSTDKFDMAVIAFDSLEDFKNKDVIDFGSQQFSVQYTTDVNSMLNHTVLAAPTITDAVTGGIAEHAPGGPYTSYPSTTYTVGGAPMSDINFVKHNLKTF